MRNTHIILIVLVIAVIVLLTWIPYGLTRGEITARVLRAERVVSGSGESTTSKYLIFTDQETLQNTDCLWAGKFRSSDLYGQIMIDSTYTFEVYGWRIPFLSMYRNILTATTVK